MVGVVVNVVDGGSQLLLRLLWRRWIAVGFGDSGNDDVYLVVSRAVVVPEDGILFFQLSGRRPRL